MSKQTILLTLIALVISMLAINILKLSVANDKNSTLLELASYINKDLNNLKDIKICIFNNEEILKCELDINYIKDDFIYKTHNSLLYYKFQKQINNTTYNVVLSKPCVYNKSIINAAIVFGGGTFILFVLIYLVYKNNIKSLIWYKNTMNTFFYDAMHELKTPLGIALLNADMLESNKYQKRIKAALNQMKTTYDDVGFYIENPNAKYPLKNINFSNFLKTRIDFFNSIASMKSVEFHLEITNDLYVLISEVELLRIVDNNISNAIKYTKVNSKITISLNQSNEKIIFIIQDEGIGIKDTKRIWHRYAREDLAKGGFGLGLNIVRNICKKYDIVYEAFNYEKGAIFKYSFKS
ncbi:two-component system sensor histidine kinase [Campylobacter sp. RM12651]|nr:two-component system sensor histidine kinase [Campylobacter sp. RM12651]